VNYNLLLNAFNMFINIGHLTISERSWKVIEKRRESALNEAQREICRWSIPFGSIRG